MMVLLTSWHLYIHRHDVRQYYTIVFLVIVIVTLIQFYIHRGEILIHLWGNVDFENNIFIIITTNNKSIRVKRVPINLFRIFFNRGSRETGEF
jgi:hypothetical protein